MTIRGKQYLSKSAHSSAHINIGKNITLLEEAMNRAQCVISVMGAHAGECVDTIFRRKISDIELSGKTFWLMKSPKARPPQVQKLCNNSITHAIFIEPATTGGARATTSAEAAREFSSDKRSWYYLPESIGPVTGKIDTSAAALVFDLLTTAVSETLDLWAYADYQDKQKPLKFALGCSTVCAVQQDMTSHPERIKSRYRRIVAIARFAQPYCVWLR